MRTVTRREALKLLGLGATGAVLAACAPKAQPTQPPEPTAEPTTAPVATAASAPTDTVAAAPPEAEPLPTGTAGLPEIALPTGNTLEGFEPKLANPSQPVKLLYWWGNGYQPSIDFDHALVQRISIAYPNLSVECVAGQGCDAFVTAAAAGTPPDVFNEWGCLQQGSWAARKMIIPLDEYISKDNFPMDDFLPGSMDDNIMEGKTWGMTDGAGVFLLWTHPNQFADIGKGVDDWPADTDELWDWADKLTTKDADGSIKRLGFKMPSWTWTRYSWIAMFGGVLWDTTKNEPSPDNVGVIEALNDLVAQVKHFGVDALDRWSTGIGSGSGEQDPWMSGNATIQMEGDWAGQSIFDYFPKWQYGQDYAVKAPPPPPAAKSHGDSGIVLWTWSWVIPSGVKNPDWSWELIRFMLSREYQINAYAKFKEIVVRKSMLGDRRFWWPYYKPVEDVFLRSGRRLQPPMPMNPYRAEYENLLGEAFDNVLHLKETPEAAMARVKTEIQAKIKEGASS